LCSLRRCCWLERRRTLRRPVEGESPRTGRNLVIAGLGAVALQIAERPVVSRVSRLVARRRWGLLQQVPLPGWLSALIAASRLISRTPSSDADANPRA